MRFDRDDARVGLLVVASVLVFASLVFHRGFKALLGKEKRLVVRVEDASDLVVGTEVQLQGLRVGQVQEIRLVQEGVGYYFLASLNFRPDIHLWQGVKVVQSSKLLGGSFLELKLPPVKDRKAPLQDGAIISGEQGSAVKDVITHVDELIKNLNGMITDLREPIREKGLSSLLDNPQLKKALISLDVTLREAGALMKDGRGAVSSNSGALEKNLASLEALLSDVRGLLGRRTKDIEGILVNLEKTTGEFQGLGKESRELVQRVGPESEAVMKALQRNLKVSEELLQLLKQKPSRILWGKPTAQEMEEVGKALENHK